MMIYGPNDAKTKAIAAAFAVTPGIAARRMDEMEDADPTPNEGPVEVGKLKERDRESKA